MRGEEPILNWQRILNRKDQLVAAVCSWSRVRGEWPHLQRGESELLVQRLPHMQ